MFPRNTTKVTVPALTTKRVTVPTLHALKKQVVGAAAVAAKSAEEAAHKVDAQAHATKAVAAPRLAAAGESATATAHAARDRVDETLPKISEALAGLLAAGQAAQSDATAKVTDVATHAKEVVTGEAKKKEKRKKGIIGSLLSALLTLAAAGAVIAYLRQRQAQPKDDPWARPLTDPYVATATGRAASVDDSAPLAAPEGVTTVTEVEVEGEAPVAHPADNPAVDSDDVEIVDLTTESTTQAEQRRDG